VEYSALMGVSQSVGQFPSDPEYRFDEVHAFQSVENSPRAARFGRGVRVGSSVLLASFGALSAIRERADDTMS
jgi:hypothetical protein